MNDIPAYKKRSRAAMFLTLLKVGAFTIGGGYAMIPIMQTEFVEKMKWMDEGEFTDMVALAQAVPGAMVINLSVYMGYTLFGVSGALLGLLGSALPSLVVMGVIGLFYVQLRDRFAVLERVFSAVKPVVAGIIFTAAIRMANNVDANWLNCLMMLGAVVAVAALGVNPILCIAAGGALGILLMREKRDKEGVQ